LRVLIVDDNSTNRQIVEHQVRAWKMRSNSAKSGSEALQTLETSGADPFHFAILDLQMPEMDGLTLARAIKDNPATAQIRLVMLSSLGRRFAAAELASAGIEAYLVKPVRQSRLHACLAGLVGRTRMPCAAAAGAASTVLSELRNLRILLAEDNSINQTVALGQLRKLGYVADAVGNGLEVLAATERASYDVIFMDCQMPELDGYAATEEIRKRERAKGSKPVHIIAMTAHAMKGDREKCLEAGMNDYLSKPVRARDLQQALERYAASAAKPGPSASEQADAAAAAATELPGATEEPPVDVERLRELTDGNPEDLRQLIDAYCAQADELMGSLGTAIHSGSPEDVHRLAHKLGGSSLTCGMTAIVAPLRELEARAQEIDPGKACEYFAQAGRGLASIRRFFAQYPGASQPPSSPSSP